MSLLSQVVETTVSAAAEDTTRVLTMQHVYDATEDETESKRVARLEDFFNTPLSDLPCDTAWFDENFPSVRLLGAEPLPGADRDFWTSPGAYRKWREVVRRRIRSASGERAREAELSAREDGWSTFLALLKRLSEHDGPVHPAQHGAIGRFANLARAADLEPGDLTLDHVSPFLKTLSPYDCERALHALKILGRLKRVRLVAANLPADFDPKLLAPELKTPVSERIRKMAHNAVETARYDDGTYDDISETRMAKFNDQTANTYEAALIALARTAADTGAIDLDDVTSLQQLFACEVRRAVLKRWTTGTDTPAGLTARSATGYASIVAQIGEALGTDMSAWRGNLKNNETLIKGRADGQRMAPKNQRFCELLLSDRRKTRTFLRQHILYRDIAENILATDHKLTEADKRRVRMFGTCAAFSALELRGAGIRKGSALAIKCLGPDQNLFDRKVGDERWFELRISKKDMKGEYVQLPPIPVRDDSFAGYEIIDWFLSRIRPLFTYANKDFCGENGITPTAWLFASEQSNQALRGGLLYRWMTQCSTEIGLRMTPHNYRHGFATLLIGQSWDNKRRAADYLGCSEPVLERNYAWIDKRKKIEETQDLLAGMLSC